MKVVVRSFLLNYLLQHFASSWQQTPTVHHPDQGGFNSGYYSNPKVDELLNAARSSTDQNERARLYQEMQTIVQDDAPWVFVANWKQNAVTNSSVENFSLQPSFFLLLKDVVKN